ncbi:MAG: hypothetical protein H6624_00475 [Bdellovibrionaceae bacterium]|nr:hypothetical protein [Bdellovibrionales bacterium]MCB9082782.1 hypothetical protein [Pseudobdellovibrionaceae bacterium]
MFGASSCASLSIESRSIDSQTYLKSRLGESIQRIQERDHFALRYCPDNTCDEIAFDHMTPEPVAWDVLLAFLTLKSSYYVLRDFKTEAVSKAIPNLTNRYQVTEAPKADFSGADIYDTLKQSYKFTVYFVRFDENHVSRIISPEN